MKTPDLSGMRAVSCLLGKNHLGLKTVIALAAMLVLQIPGFSEQSPGRAQNTQQSISTKKPSRDDILIVQLAEGVDRDQFDQLLQDVHGTFLRTIEIGPTLKFQVILTESGEAAQVAKRLTGNKEIALVQRNTIYRIKNDVARAEHAGGGGGGKGPIHSKTRVGHGGSRHGHGGSGSNFTTATQPPVVYSPPLGGSTNDPYSSSEWDLSMMNFIQARDSGAPYATPVPMYICDTGYTLTADSPGMVIQLNFSDPINPTGGQESIFDVGAHGTETATVTSYTDNGTGFSGMANLSGQRVMFYELRISADGQSAGMLNILTALSWIANNSGLLPGPICLSYNLPPPNSLNANPSMQQVALQLVQRGFLLVNAAGNDGMQDTSPEMYMRRVAAVSMSGYLTSYSNFGNFNTAAPGEGVACYTPAGGTSQSFDSGTSFAAPRWCAAIAIVMGAQQPANRNAVTADLIIRQTGIINGQGFIIPDLNAALQSAAGF